MTTSKPSSTQQPTQQERKPNPVERQNLLRDKLLHRKRRSLRAQFEGRKPVVNDHSKPFSFHQSKDE